MNSGVSRWLYRVSSLVIISMLVAGLALGDARPVEAATITVDDDYTAATPGWGTTAFATIQEAVNAAAAGDTVDVKAGTYIEQVTITKNLTLHSTENAVIQAYDSMTQDCTSPQLPENRPIVCVSNSFVTIQGFTIDGVSKALTNPRLMGIAFRNAGGVVQNNTIQNIRFATMSSLQEGVGIYLYNSDLTARTINIIGNTITGFNKNGITLTSHSSWDPVSFLIQGNTITGLGPNQTTVQNGIQIELPRGSGIITGNTISNIAYNNTANPNALVANSILNLNTLSMATTDNTITGAQGGIFYFDAQGQISNNTISVVKPGLNAFGILASDPPWAVPSPYDSTYISGATSNNAFNGAALQAVLSIEVAGNTVAFPGTSKSSTKGIAAEAGIGGLELDLNVHDNTVSGFADGLGFYQCEPNNEACSYGIFSSIRAVGNNLTNNVAGINFTGAIDDLITTIEVHHNRLFGNTTGLNNLTYGGDMVTPIPITAENNWWGCNTGPDTSGCDASDLTGSVDFDPWLVLTATLPPTPIQAGDGAALVANLKTNSLDEDTSTGGFYVPNTTSADFTADFGNLNPVSSAFALGLANSTYTAPTSETTDHVCVTVDSEAVCSDLVVEPLPVFTVFLPLINR
jgi:hypothetical protein